MTLPAWVRKRDGTLVPFDPDKISRALFAAGESLGLPDAFLARELADGVVHFLAAECDDNPPTSMQIADSVVKLVRELGQPALAQAFADGAWVRARHEQKANAALQASEPLRLVIPITPDVSSAKLTAACLRGYALQAVYSRDLAAAHRDGLLTLTGLEAPFELAGAVLKPEFSLVEAIANARQETAGFVAIDGPEYALESPSEGLAAYVRQLEAALRSTGLHAVINLNCAAPPSWAEFAAGPLFAGPLAGVDPSGLKAIADGLLEALLCAASPALEIDWHLGEADCRPEDEERLLRLARRSIDSAAVAFVFDRPRRPIALAPGIDRQHPAVLLTIQLNLPVLAAQAAGYPDAPARFLQKLGSLVRLALSAGVQKRDFLRRRVADHPELARGFLLDRARLVVAPVGLHQVVAALLGHTPEEDADALEFARRVVERLRDVVDEDGRSRHLEVCLDGALFGLSEASQQTDCSLGRGRSLVRIATALHDSAPLGTLAVATTAGDSLRADQIVASLRSLWERSAVTRLCLRRADQPLRQLTFSG